MTIAQLDPNDIKEIIETDSMITAVMNLDVAKKYIENVDDCEKILLDGMDLRLNGFDKIVKDGSEGELFFKINLKLGQFMYATSDKPGSDEILAHFMPQFIKGSEDTGLKLVDVRAAATESLGSMKRAKGVTSTEELMDILKEEMEWSGEQSSNIKESIKNAEETISKEQPITEFKDMAKAIGFDTERFKKTEGEV